MRSTFPKVYLPEVVLKGYYAPPNSPRECIFAQTTNCISADLTTRIAPCQFGGRPVCSECGCIASGWACRYRQVQTRGIPSGL